MNEQQKIDLIIRNLYETITNISDTRDILMKNKETKGYIESFEKFEDEYQKKVGIEKANERFEQVVNYEQAISTTAFLIGFQKGVQAVKTIEDKNFVENMLKVLM